MRKKLFYLIGLGVATITLASCNGGDSVFGNVIKPYSNEIAFEDFKDEALASFEEDFEITAEIGTRVIADKKKTDVFENFTFSCDYDNKVAKMEMSMSGTGIPATESFEYYLQEEDYRIYSYTNIDGDYTKSTIAVGTLKAYFNESEASEISDYDISSYLELGESLKCYYDDNYYTITMDVNSESLGSLIPDLPELNGKMVIQIDEAGNEAMTLSFSLPEGSMDLYMKLFITNMEVELDRISIKDNLF